MFNDNFSKNCALFAQHPISLCETKTDVTFTHASTLFSKPFSQIWFKLNYFAYKHCTWFAKVYRLDSSPNKPQAYVNLT